MIDGNPGTIDCTNKYDGAPEGRWPARSGKGLHDRGPEDDPGQEQQRVETDAGPCRGGLNCDRRGYESPDGDRREDDDRDNRSRHVGKHGIDQGRSRELRRQRCRDRDEEHRGHDQDEQESLEHQSRERPVRSEVLERPRTCDEEGGDRRTERPPLLLRRTGFASGRPQIGGDQDHDDRKSDRMELW